MTKKAESVMPDVLHDTGLDSRSLIHVTSFRTSIIAKLQAKGRKILSEAFIRLFVPKWGKHTGRQYPKLIYIGDATLRRLFANNNTFSVILHSRRFLNTFHSIIVIHYNLTRYFRCSDSCHYSFANFVGDIVIARNHL